MSEPALGLYGELFVDQEMERLFSDSATLQAMLDFEAALAAAQAGCRLIPQEAAGHIAAQCNATLYDPAAIGRAATLAGNPAIPLVKALTARVAEQDADAAKWVHYGATSQDVIDSGAARQYRAAQDLLVARIARLMDALAALTRTHRHTPMIGRTFLQHAVPISFGVKAAHWLEPLLTLSETLQQESLSPHELGGAAGTLASLGSDAARLREALGARTGPDHTSRAALARTAAELGMLTGHLGKIALDIALMAQTEIAELAEPEAPGKGGSSAMPHKRNPVLCTLILSAAKRTPALVATMLACLPQEHERAIGGWHAEWRTMAELFRTTGAALAQSVTLIGGLQVFPERMRSNLELTQGLVMAERVSLALAPLIGRSQAHHLLEEASRRCLTQGRHLHTELASMPEITAALPPAELEALFDPASYRGASDAIIDAILSRYQQNRGRQSHA